MYKLRNLNLGGQDIIRLNDGVIIPMDNANTDYIEYLEWINEGNEPEPAD